MNEIERGTIFVDFQSLLVPVPAENEPAKEGFEELARKKIQQLYGEWVALSVQLVICTVEIQNYIHAGIKAFRSGNLSETTGVAIVKMMLRFLNMADPVLGSGEQQMIISLIFNWYHEIPGDDRSRENLPDRVLDLALETLEGETRRWYSYESERTKVSRVGNGYFDLMFPRFPCGASESQVEKIMKYPIHIRLVGLDGGWSLFLDHEQINKLVHDFYDDSDDELGYGLDHID